MYRLALAAFLLLFLFSQRLSCQVDSLSNKVLSGIIVDDSLGVSLPYVHLWNVRSRMGAISNEYGAFRINIEDQDTITFSTLGYFGETIIVSDTSLTDEFVVRLKPRKYEIDELVVRRWRSYAAFKQDFLSLELPATEIEPLKEHLKLAASVAAVEADRERAAKEKAKGFGFSTPLGKGINVQKARMKELDDLDKREQIIHEKFNRSLVGDLTKLEGDELTEFIALCNFSDDYLYSTDLYTIIEALYAKFDTCQTSLDKIPPAN